MAKHFQRKGRRYFGLDLQSWIKGFFGGNAGLSIVILFLICAFLVLEAIRFFPTHHEGLVLYRKSGQEFVGHLIQETDDYQEFVSWTNQAYFQEFDERFGRERGVVEGFDVLVGILEDDGEEQFEALEDARDGDDAVILQKAEADWKAFAVSAMEGVKRNEVDSFGRLKGKDEVWKQLIEAGKSYDPVEEDLPPFVAAAKKEMKSGMASFEKAKDEVAYAGIKLKDLRNKLVKIAAEVKSDAVADRSAADRKAAILEGAEKLEGEAKAAAIAEAGKIVIRDEFPFAERVKPIEAAKDEHQAAAAELKTKLLAGVAALPSGLTSPNAAFLIENVQKRVPGFVEGLDESVQEASDWKWDEKVSYPGSIAKFVFGTDWVTNSSWHDVYGLLPLLTGSVLISLIALSVAVPFSIGAAIYVNRLASPFEQTFIKPAIEMIQAIPSIVLGFFGIMVLGEFLMDASQKAWLSWIPGFPITERLNMLNAGLLLALMAVPTIFTLCEDALNNVPRSFSEASLALGASKLQTVNKVIVPAAISGILAAVLLGLGRVIGETMVVLLVAGNKISLPDWTAGVGVVTQPTHTMTGIIAQEMGEVSAGTLHYRALFLVGLVLFTISLMINVAAQRIIKRFGIHD
ncbi:phosphate ABC transporter permease subunit PstC [Verrucomicrobiaceae bacterium 227]